MSTNIQINADKNKTMLIIGKGAIKYGVKDINYESSYDEVVKKYGDSDLSKAFKIAKDNNVDCIFLMNIMEDIQYLEIGDILAQIDFAYIVFASLYLSDTFNDTYNGNLRRSYIAYLIGYVGHNKTSVFVVTDKHASLYEDLDAYISDMNQVCKDFKRRCTARANMENVLFIGNNLKDYKMANIILTSKLCSTEPYEYPKNGFGEAIFDIDERDGVTDFAYFKNHTIRGTTIENFVNFLQNGVITKVAYISRIIKALGRYIDFTEFLGRQYSTYQKVCIKEKLKVFLNAKLNILIRKYEIVSVEAYKDTPGAVTVLLRFKVWPICTTEAYTIEREVLVG